MNQKTANQFTQEMRNLTQIQMPEDRFSEIQMALATSKSVHKHRLVTFLSVAAVMVLSLLFFTQQKDLDQKDLLIETLVKRTVQLEQLLSNEEPNYSTPGSKITERIVKMEHYVAQLNEDIKLSQNKQRTSELMATKLDILGHLVLLQRKINQKPNYQKVKPYII